MPTRNLDESTPRRPELDAAARFVYEVGHLKRVPRTGWFLAGVHEPETVAEHTARVTIVGMLLAAMSSQDADIGRVAMLCALHDVAETRIGDIASVSRPYLQKPVESLVTSDQTLGLPDDARALVLGLVGEYEACSSLEARLAHDADKIECLAQAREYESFGNPRTSEWVRGSLESLVTDEGRELAAALLECSPSAWWGDFVANYRSRGPSDSH
jgi:putative hydrolase of HD superfamily